MIKHEDRIRLYPAQKEFKERRSEIVQMLSSGATLAEVSTCFDISRQRVSQIAKREGFDMRNSKEKRLRRKLYYLLRCNQCNGLFMTPKYNSKIRFFCSSECRNDFTRKSNLHENRIKYKLIYAQGHYRYQHRIVMEKLLNRRLESNEVVHHINGIKNDNRVENLIVMSSVKHGREHSDKMLQNKNLTPKIVDIVELTRDEYLIAKKTCNCSREE